MTVNLVFGLVLVTCALGVREFPAQFGLAGISDGERMIVWAIFLVGGVIVWRLPTDKPPNPPN